MYSGINVQVNAQVEVWDCDPLHDDECLDMIHDDDDVMMHAMMMNTLWCTLSYTYYDVQCHEAMMHTVVNNAMVNNTFMMTMI